MSERKEILRKLIRLEGEFLPLVRRLRQLPWDSEESPVLLTRSNVVAVLDRYLVGGLSEDDLENWANEIEGREDIDFDEVSKDAIFELANPLLNRALNPKVIHGIRDRLMK